MVEITLCLALPFSLRFSTIFMDAVEKLDELDIIISD